MHSLAPVVVTVADRAAEVCIQIILSVRESMKESEIAKIQTTNCFGRKRWSPLSSEQALHVWSHLGFGSLPDSSFYAWGDLDAARQIRALCSVAAGPFVYLSSYDAAIVRDNSQ